MCRRSRTFRWSRLTARCFRHLLRRRHTLCCSSHRRRLCRLLRPCCLVPWKRCCRRRRSPIRPDSLGSVSHYRNPKTPWPRRTNTSSRRTHLDSAWSILLPTTGTHPDYVPWPCSTACSAFRELAKKGRLQAMSSNARRQGPDLKKQLRSFWGANSGTSAGQSGTWVREATFGLTFLGGFSGGFPHRNHVAVPHVGTPTHRSSLWHEAQARNSLVVPLEIPGNNSKLARCNGYRRLHPTHESPLAVLLAVVRTIPLFPGMDLQVARRQSNAGATPS